MIKTAKQNGLIFKEKMMRLSDVYGADECFLTGTAAEIIPVVSLDGSPVGKGVPGTLTAELRQDFKRLTETDGEAY